MRNLSSTERLDLSEGSITARIGADTQIGTNRPKWDLGQIAALVTADTLAKAETHAEAVRSTRDRAPSGGIVGAAFDTLASDSPKEPTAKVGVIFGDGEALSLEVNAVEYSMLQTATHRALKRPEDARRGPALISLPMSRDDAEYILDKRRKGASIGIMLPFVILGAIVFALGRFLPGLFDGPDIPILIRLSSWLGLTGGGVLIAFGFFKGMFPPKAHVLLRPGEAAAYDALCRPEPAASPEPT